MTLAWCKKPEKRKKKQENLGKILQKMCNFQFAAKCFLRVLFPEKHVYRYKKEQKDAMRLKVATFYNLWVFFSGN